MRAARTVVGLATLILCTRVAAADDLRPPPISAVVVPDDVPEIKSPWLAFGMSAGLTAVGVGLVLVPLATEPDDPVLITTVATGTALVLIAPSAGSLYTGHRQRATAMIAARVGAVLVGFALDSSARGDGWLDATMVGGAVAAGLAVADVVWAPLGAREYNRDAAIASVSLAPMIAPQARGSAGGLSVVGSF